jgi:hypothetical protein
MNKNWKMIAAGLNLGLPQEELESLQVTLDGLDDAYDPLARQLSPGIEPAILFECPLEEEL